MASRRQVAANRKNAKRSTGPATPAGRTISSQNAIKHGLLSQNLFVLPWEDPVEFSLLAAYLFDDWQPKGWMENFLVEQIASLQWRMHRARAWETGIIADRVRAGAGFGEQPYHKPVLKISLDESPAKTTQSSTVNLAEELRPTVCAVGRAFVVDVQDGDALSKVRRHEVSLERSLYRAIDKLEHLQARRKTIQAIPTSTTPSTGEETPGAHFDRDAA